MPTTTNTQSNSRHHDYGYVSILIGIAKLCTDQLIAHRPTFDPVCTSIICSAHEAHCNRHKERRPSAALRTINVFSRLTHTLRHGKWFADRVRSSLTCPSQFGQGSEVETQQRDLRAELLQAEAAHFAKKNGVPVDEPKVETATPKRQLEGGSPGDDAKTEEEDPEAKRRRILEETRDIDADSDESEDDSSEDERSDLRIF